MRSNRTKHEEYVAPQISDQGDLRNLTHGGDGEAEEDYLVWGNRPGSSCELPAVDE
jgi:hypothetical protein